MAACVNDHQSECEFVHLCVCESLRVISEFVRVRVCVSEHLGVCVCERMIVPIK